MALGTVCTRLVPEIRHRVWEGSQPTGESERGQEEAALLAALPDSAELRSLVGDLETLMRAGGFLHLSLTGMAERLGCSGATLSRLAATRHDLFELVINIWLARARDTAWREFDAAQDWAQKLVGFLKAASIATRDTSVQFLRDLRTFSDGSRALLHHRQRGIADLEGIIDAGVTAGAFRDVNPRLLAAILFDAIGRLTDPVFLASLSLPITDAFDCAYQVFEYGLVRHR